MQWPDALCWHSSYISNNDSTRRVWLMISEKFYRTCYNCLLFYHYFSISFFLLFPLHSLLFSLSFYFCFYFSFYYTVLLMPWNCWWTDGSAIEPREIRDEPDPRLNTYCSENVDEKSPSSWYTWRTNNTRRPISSYTRSSNMIILCAIFIYLWQVTQISCGFYACVK